MKKINIFLLTFLMMVISVVSCKNKLEETVYSSLAESNAYETVEDAEVLILSVYAALRGGINVWGAYYTMDYLELGELPTDYGQDGSNSGVPALESGTWGNEQPFVLNLWEGAYKVVTSANFAIRVLEGMAIDADAKAGFIAEAKFLRALAYYDLTFNFKDVILNLGNTNEDLPLSPQADIIAVILSDLTDAQAGLPSYDTYGAGRATKGAALALRAKTHLNNKNWAEAAVDAKAVMDLGEYTLFPSVVDLFDIANKSVNEWIFVVHSQEGNGAESFIAARTLHGTYRNLSHGSLMVSVDFYNSFDLNDERRSLMVNGYQDVQQRIVIVGSDTLDQYWAAPGTLEYTILEADPTIDLNLSPFSFIPTIKYLGGYDRFSDNPGGNAGVNYPVMRYADILLVRAEGLNETGDQGGATALVNQVRARAGVADLPVLSQAALRDAILEERAKELFMEGHRTIDLRRTGKYIELWKASLEAKYPTASFSYLNDSKYYFGIPQREIDANSQINN